MCRGGLGARCETHQVDFYNGLGCVSEPHHARKARTRRRSQWRLLYLYHLGLQLLPHVLIQRQHDGEAIRQVRRVLQQRHRRQREDHVLHPTPSPRVRARVLEVTQSVLASLV